MRRAWLMVMMVSASVSSVFAESPVFEWRRLADLPDAEGFGGMFAGVSGGALIAAGGSNFKREADGSIGPKQWTDAIFVLREPDGEWERVEATLPMPLAYGVSATHGGALICAGGNNADGQHADTFALTWDGERVTVRPLPPMPRANAYTCGGVVGDTLYVAGGLPVPGEIEASSEFFALDLPASGDAPAWRELETWPGPGRQNAVAAVAGGQFLLISGMAFEADAAGKAKLIVPYLQDAYAYTPGAAGEAGRWRRLADLPEPVAAAPNFAATLGASRIAVCGGIAGVSYTDVPDDVYTPFPRLVSVYDLDADRWHVTQELAEDASRVTAPGCHWAGGYVIVAGERKARHRSPYVYFARPLSP